MRERKTGKNTAISITEKEGGGHNGGPEVDLGVTEEKGRQNSSEGKEERGSPAFREESSRQPRSRVPGTIGGGTRATWEDETRREEERGKDETVVAAQSE